MAAYTAGAIGWETGHETARRKRGTGMSGVSLPRTLGDYTLVRRLAVGGMAEVYVAKALGLSGFEKLVAIKVIHPRYSEDEQFIQMLIDEAKLSVLLTHTNIAQTFDLGCIDGTYFIVMEYVEGADAYQLLKQVTAQKKRIPVDLCAHLVAEMCHGLDYAHRKRDARGHRLSIVHRDVSPQNLLVSFSGEVKVADFGIAKATRSSDQTETGVLKGKYFYMSPEQAWADPLDARSDIFSAGIVLHELLTGSMLYEGETLQEVLAEVRNAEIAPPSKKRADIPMELDEIVMKALAKQPERRWRTAHEMALALSQFVYRQQPAFTAARVARLMAEAFADHEGAASVEPRDDGTGVLQSIPGLPRRTESLGPSVMTPRTPPTDPAPKSSATPRMTPEEFRPDPTRSLLIDMHFEDETEPERPPRKTRLAKVQQTQDEDTERRPSWEGEVGDRERPTTEPDMPPLGQALEAGLGGGNKEEKTKGEVITLDLGPDSLPEHDEDPTNPLGERVDVGLAEKHPPLNQLVGGDRTDERPIPPPESAVSTLPPPREPTSVPGDSSATSQQAEVPSASPDGHAAERESAGGTWLIPALLVAICAVLALWILQSGERAELNIVSVPPGATVEIDGRVVPGQTPLLITDGLTEGESVSILATRSGYAPWRRTIQVEAGRARHIAMLTRIRVPISISTVPEGARVFVNGSDRGRAPVELGPIPVGRTLSIRALWGDEAASLRVLLEEDMREIIVRRP